MSKRKEMTETETERLDSLEWKVRCFLTNINPNTSANGTIGPEDWDMDSVDAIIETAWNRVYKFTGVCTENEFYPYRDEDDEGDGEKEAAEGSKENA